MENQNTEQNEVVASQGGGNKVIIIAMGIVIAILLGVCGFLYSKLGDVETIVVNQQTTLEGKDTEIADLTTDLEAKIAEYEAVKQEYEALGIDKTELEGQLEELKAQVEKYKNATFASADEKKKLKKELELTIARHQIELSEKDSEIERYKLMADKLANSVDSLLVEQGVAAEKINNLADKVEIASVLRAENIKVVSLNEKNKEDNDNEFKAKNIAKLKLTFSLADNKVAKHDTKDIVFRLIQPDGSISFDLNSGGGSFTTAEGKTEFYTSRKDLEFNNTKQTLDFIYAVNPAEPLKPGAYKVEVFANGHSIGESAFTVK